MRILGIDYGQARAGIAITDELKITSQGLRTINHNGNDKKLLAELDQIMEQYEIETIVVGMPLNMNGTKSERVQKTEKFIFPASAGITPFPPDHSPSLPGSAPVSWLAFPQSSGDDLCFPAAS